jgi:hypothetical protein
MRRLLAQNIAQRRYVFRAKNALWHGSFMALDTPRLEFYIPSIGPSTRALSPKCVSADTGRGYQEASLAFHQVGAANVEKHVRVIDAGRCA